VACVGISDAFMGVPAFGRVALSRAARQQGLSIRPSLAAPTRTVPAARSLGLGGLSMQADAITKEKPLKVVIAGAGVGGLFLAKALRNQVFAPCLLESSAAPPAHARPSAPLVPPQAPQKQAAGAEMKGLDAGVLARMGAAGHGGGGPGEDVQVCTLRGADPAREQRAGDHQGH